MASLNHISPFFIITDINQSVNFYVNQLGFDVQYIGPEDEPFFAIVGRDNISLMLKAIADDIKPAPNNTRHEWAPWDAFISVADPDALFEEYSSGGVTFRKPIHNNDDGLRGFEVTDADGYVLYFGRPKA